MPINALGLSTHSFMVHGSKFEICERYTILEPIGQGAYGVVCAAKDTDADAADESASAVAVKKIENAFEHITFTKRTLRELRILRHLQHENLIDIRNIFVPGTRDDFEDVYVVCGLMETDLASILKSSQGLSDDHCQFFLYQVLRGMKYVHSANVIHRDLKPRNLLVNSNCDLKICDFGLARVNFTEDGFRELCPMTEYVCTRWYRAPEVLCSWTDYSRSVDNWSIGCIMAEMLGRKAIFPGHNTQNQLQLIIKMLGTPSKEALKKIPNEKCRKFIEALPVCKRRTFDTVYTDATKEALDILDCLVQFEEAKRYTVDQALKHPYLSQLHCPEDEPTRTPLIAREFEFERRKITEKALRDEIFLECLTYYPDKYKQYAQEKSKRGETIEDCRLLQPGESQYSDDEDGD